MKVYGDEQGKNYLKTKIFPDGSVESKINLKVPKSGVEAALDALKKSGLAVIPMIGDFLDPFDADAIKDLRGQICPWLLLILRHQS